MPDLNPYEPPETPLRARKKLKYGLGIGLILWLTTPAAIIAVGGSCVASNLNRELPWWLFLVAPIVCVAAFMLWAAAVEAKSPTNATRRRIGIFLATPFVLGLAIALGRTLAMLILESTSQPGRGETGAGMLVAFLLAWFVPVGALLAMLWVGWRTRGRAD